MKKQVNGNTEGIRTTVLTRIAAVYDLKMAAGEFASHALVDELAALTGGGKFPFILAGTARWRMFPLAIQAR